MPCSRNTLSGKSILIVRAIFTPHPCKSEPSTVILDARVENVPLDWAVQVAIVGAGPAGMTLARELAGVARVLVIEGGGFESDANQQALLVGECAGMDYPLTETRAR